MQGQFDQLADSQDPRDRQSRPLPPVDGSRSALRRQHTVGGVHDSDEGHLDAAEPATGTVVKTQEEWDGSSGLSVKTLDAAGNETGSAYDIPVVVLGSGARPYINTGEIHPTRYDGSTQTLIVDPDEFVGKVVEAWVPVADVAASGAAAVTTGKYMWWRRCDGGSVNVLNASGTTLDGVTAPDLGGKITPGYDSADADYSGTDGSGRPNDTGGHKRHNDAAEPGEKHDDHAVSVETIADNLSMDLDNTVDLAEPDDGGTTPKIPCIAYPDGGDSWPSDSSGAGEFTGGGATITLSHTRVDHRDPFHTLLKMIKVA